MGLTVTIQSRYVFFLVSLFVVVLSVGIVESFGTSNPTVVGHSTSEIAPGTLQGNFSFNGSVGIGTTSPSQALSVVGTVSATTFSGSGSGITGITGSSVTDGSLTASDADSDSIQSRVTGTCSVGSSIRSINNAGGVVCDTGTTATLSCEAKTDSCVGPCTATVTCTAGKTIVFGLRGGDTSGSELCATNPGVCNQGYCTPGSSTCSLTVSGWGAGIQATCCNLV
jgi:hypothetical protein